MPLLPLTGAHAGPFPRRAASCSCRVVSVSVSRPAGDQQIAGLSRRAGGCCRPDRGASSTPPHQCHPSGSERLPRHPHARSLMVVGSC
ncbi:hypothetical protein GGTG_05004 [Gaeumannomyces tritici R3-111a-1]|uniref:Uncharacterized protein n=1 Tax=Gaeumannomyces tritici (strain R3-111a-1) TaxID=644352 RepID=J3NUP8_GAET3|nr:hypothetical protein GGTG_05004 [Gaeumannomyces tritici R3-111a-1]EJT79922.1 hypothetical protein GGTG_05004 [Gaeumannomyces tritici R3-111a-1]